MNRFSATLDVHSQQATGALDGIVLALGGINEMTSNVPTYVPLDEYVSQRFLEDVDGDFNANDLVLEGVFDGG